MLKGIPTAISPDLLHLMMTMGHGDCLVLADGNFPADSSAQRIVRADGLDMPTVLEAVLQFLPMDTYVDDPVQVMQPVDDSIPEPPIWTTFRGLLEASEGRPMELALVERFDFYERARNAYGIVATSETALYANVILTKGVVVGE